MAEKFLSKKGVFITGSDTGVGKTVVTALIAMQLQQKGIDISVMKPVETGCTLTNGALVPGDGTWLKEILDLSDSMEHIVPVRYELPLAPMVASEIEDRPVNIQKIMSSVEYMQARRDYLIIEGIGGLRVPIKEDFFVSDLILALSLPVVVVSRVSIGTINHTLLTLESAASMGIEVKGIILNHSDPPDNDIAEKTNPQIIARLCQTPVLGTIPYIKPLTKKKLHSTGEFFNLFHLQ